VERRGERIILFLLVEKFGRVEDADCAVR